MSTTTVAELEVFAALLAVASPAATRSTPIHGRRLAGPSAAIGRLAHHLVAYLPIAHAANQALHDPPPWRKIGSRIATGSVAARHPDRPV